MKFQPGHATGEYITHVHREREGAVVEPEAGFSFQHQMFATVQLSSIDEGLQRPKGLRLEEPK